MTGYPPWDRPDVVAAVAPHLSEPAHLRAFNRTIEFEGEVMEFVEVTALRRLDHRDAYAQVRLSPRLISDCAPAVWGHTCAEQIEWQFRCLAREAQTPPRPPLRRPWAFYRRRPRRMAGK